MTVQIIFSESHNPVKAYYLPHLLYPNPSNKYSTKEEEFQCHRSTFSPPPEQNNNQSIHCAPSLAQKDLVIKNIKHLNKHYSFNHTPKNAKVINPYSTPPYNNKIQKFSNPRKVNLHTPKIIEIKPIHPPGRKS